MIERLKTALLVSLALLPVRAAAHDVRPAPMATIDLQESGNHGDRLTVRIEVPTDALVEANLPRDAAGRLVGADLATALAVIAREASDSLALEQHGEPRPTSTRTAIASAAGDSISIALEYQIQPGVGGVSARLHGYRIAGSPIATTVSYVDSDLTRRRFAIADDSQKVQFDPSQSQAARRALGLARGALGQGAIPLVFFLALIVPIRRRGWWPALAAYGVAQTVGVIGGTLLPADWLGALEMLPAVAASTVVVLALQNVVDRDSSFLSLLASGFGLITGVQLGFGFSAEGSFFGSHPLLALLVYDAALIAAALWAAAVLDRVRDFLVQRGIPARWLLIAVSLLAAHTGLHQIVGNAALADPEATTLNHAAEWLIAFWVGAAILAGAWGQRTTKDVR